MKKRLQIPNIDDPIEGKILRERNNINDTVIEFDVPTTPEPINSGDTTSSIIGKILRWITYLKSTAFSGNYNDLSNKPETLPSHILKDRIVEENSFDVQLNEENSESTQVISDGNHKIITIFGDKDSLSPIALQLELTKNKDIFIRKGTKKFTTTVTTDPETGDRVTVRNPPKIKWDEEWEPLANFLNVNRTPQVNNSSGIPYAGSVDLLSDHTDITIDDWRSGFYSISDRKLDTTWRLYISARHRNGFEDGNKYGMYLATKMTNTNGSSDLYWNRQEPSGWQGDRVILDSHNYSRFIESSSGTNASNLSKVLKNYFYDIEGFENGVVEEVNTFEGNTDTTSGVVYALVSSEKVSQPIDGLLTFFWHDQYWAMQMGFTLNKNTHLQIRGRDGGGILDWSEWKTVLDSENYVNYTISQKMGADDAYINRTDLSPQLIDVEGHNLIAGYWDFWTILNIGAHNDPNASVQSYRTQLLFPYQFDLNDTEMFIRTATLNDGNLTPTWRQSRRVLHDGNYSDIIKKINGRLLTKHGTFVDSDQAAAPGQLGYINFARITITSNYANHTCYFGIQCRGWGFPLFLSILFNNENNTDPGLGAFYYWGISIKDVVYISKRTTSTWDLWCSKGEAYDVIEIFQMNIDDGHFKVVFPNEYRDVKEEQWIEPEVAGRVARADHLWDSSGNGGLITASYAKEGLGWDDIIWLACWNGYEIRAVNKNLFTYLKIIDNIYGMCVPYGDGSGVEDELWIRTTKKGIIPYSYNGGSMVNGTNYGVSSLGTRDWPFNEVNSYELSGAYVTTIYVRSQELYKPAAGYNFRSLIKLGGQSIVIFNQQGGEIKGFAIATGSDNQFCIYPNQDNNLVLGTSTHQIGNIYLRNAPIISSDKNQKNAFLILVKSLYIKTHQWIMTL